MKTRLFLPALLFLFALNATAARIESNPGKDKVENMSEEEKKARLEQIKQRVYEIKAIDKSTLTRSERKELRKELKAMKQQAREVQGVYLSVGAIIIIILLLILIL